MAKTWRDMTPEQKARDAAAHKRRKYLRESGRPSLVPVGPAHRKAITLRDVYSMSCRDIAERVGLSQSTVSDLIRGHRGPAKGSNPIVKIPRSTHDKIMAYVPDEAFYNPAARVEATGTRRRLQALALQGFSTQQMAAFVGGTNYNQVWRVMRGLKRRHYSSAEGQADWVHASTRDKVGELFAKYINVDPLDVGGTELSVGRAKASAERNGYRPAMCWDEDTIDDPAAAPEYTGACGTPEGYAIHLREEIKVCEPCAASVREEVGASAGAWSPTKFRILMELRGVTTSGLAALTGASLDSISRWASGERSPRPKFFAAICKALDCTAAELLDTAEGEVFHDSQFSGIAFKAALDVRCMSIRQLATEIGVSNMAVHYWINGTNTPKIPKIVKAAEVLGVDWKEFYR